MQPKIIGFAGLGLIGGSLAKTIRRIHKDITLLAFDQNEAILKEAHSNGIIDTICTDPATEFAACDLLFLCAPVQFNIALLKQLKDSLKEHCLISDVGSVKTPIHKEIASLGLSEHFIGGHPMAGSEKSGYFSSSAYLFENAYYILTPCSSTKTAALTDFQSFLGTLGTLPLILQPEQHDFVTAAVSHLPHIIAAALVQLVSKNDTPEETMKCIAAGGFKDITRIASSSPVMWEQICTSNQASILHMLDEYQALLSQIYSAIKDADTTQISTFFEDSKNYRDSIPTHGNGPIARDYFVYVDLIDEAGTIAAIAAILAGNGISLKNIGIIHNREYEQGVLRIEFYEEQALHCAIDLLRKFHYTVYEVQ